MLFRILVGVAMEGNVALLELTIPDNMQPMRLDKYLMRALPGLPAWAIREAFSRRDVKMDGLRVKADAQAIPGAKVLVYGIKEEDTAPLNVVYEDEHILLVNKPANISVQADDGGGATVESMALYHVRRDNPDAFPPKACHRLDNQTSGLLLLAKSDRAEELMARAFKDRTMKKTYTCLVKGTPNPREDTLRAFLLKDAKAAHVKVIDRSVPGAVPITTGYRVLEAGSVCRMEVDLITGRTHQIRAHLAYIGHPILGDDAYGDRAFNKEQGVKRLMLCAASITLSCKDELAYLDGRTFSILPPF
jgi:23S rRNA pseudouridine955/2504/2580 synthase